MDKSVFVKIFFQLLFRVCLMNLHEKIYAIVPLNVKATSLNCSTLVLTSLDLTSNNSLKSVVPLVKERTLVRRS